MRLMSRIWKLFFENQHPIETCVFCMARRCRADGSRWSRPARGGNRRLSHALVACRCLVISFLAVGTTSIMATTLYVSMLVSRYAMRAAGQSGTVSQGDVIDGQMRLVSRI